MTVHVLVPVHDRLEMTRRIIDCLRQQVADERIKVIVIDDGSTDGTSEYLSQQSDIVTLTSDGSLWWGGSIELGLQHVLANADAKDWVMFVNNDTEIAQDFVWQLLASARHNAPAAVGGVIRDVQPPHELLSVGAQVDPWKLTIRDRVDGLPSKRGGSGQQSKNWLHDVDALSGRGALFPVEAFVVAGTMRTRWLPHYLADYELSMRIRRAGYRLLVDEQAAVFSQRQYGSTRPSSSLRERFLSVRSASYLPAVTIFWWEASSWLQRLTLPLRIALFSVYPGLRKKSENSDR